MARVTGSHLICKGLQTRGGEKYSCPGRRSHSAGFRCYGGSGFRIIDTRHEQAAVHMADAWSRITEQPGVCMYTTPGFAGGSGAGVEAHFSRWETRATERRRAARDQPQSRSRHRPAQSRRIAVDLALDDGNQFISALHCIPCLGNAHSAARRLIWAERRCIRIQRRSRISLARYAMNVDMSRSASKLRKRSTSFSNAPRRKN